MTSLPQMDAYNGRQAPTDPRATELRGTVARIAQTWENDDGSATILANLDGGACARGPVDAVGEIVPGGCYRFLGRWANHYRWGWQFAFISFLRDAPPPGDALVAYLAKWCRGVGPVTAAKLVAAYGEGVVKVMVDDPERVVADEHLSPLVARNAAETLKRICDPAMREAHLELFRMFKGQGFYTKAIGVCLRKWHERAPEIVRRDPFVLLTSEVPGCGFARCDRLYSSLGLDPSRLKRQGLAAWHALRTRDGDTWLSLEDALRAVRQQIGGVEPCPERAVAMMVKARWLEYLMTGTGGHWLAERHKARSERDVAARMQDLLAGESAWPAGPFPSLSDHQSAELAEGLAGRVCLLTGGPGVGKTHCAAAVVKAAIRLFGRSYVAVAAPTGKAAVRITEKMQEAGLGLTATTVHRLLKVQRSSGDTWGFEFSEDNPLPFRCIVIDEVSMMDVGLAACLLRACGSGAHVLLVGDEGQLPPVGHGAFLRDLITADVPRAHLTEIRRNAGRIVHVCHEIRTGKLPVLTNNLDAWIANAEENLIHLPLGRVQTGADRLRAIEERLQAMYAWLRQQREAHNEWDLVNDVQVIVARNATRKQLNKHLQEQLNPNGQRNAASRVFRTGDKVICLKNGFYARADTTAGRGKPQQDYVANGDLGRVEGFRGQQMLVRVQAPSRLVAVPLGKVWGGAEESDEDEDDTSGGGGGGANGEDGKDKPRTGCSWDLAYACTCHKYQGSECPVVIVLVEGSGKLGSREWIYTALSRARQLCVVIGERAEMSRQVRNVTLPDRKTFLVEKLRGEITS